MRQLQYCGQDLAHQLMNMVQVLRKNGKQVFMYFCDKPLNPSLMDSEEYKRVKTFRDKYKDRGIYSTYTSTDDFQKDFYAHLSQHFLSLQKIEDMKQIRKSELCVKGLNDYNQISNTAVLKSFALNGRYSKEEYIDKIKSYYAEINSIITEKTSIKTNNSLISIPISVFPSVEISEIVKTYIIKIAKILNIDISDNFFNLGDLHESIDGILMHSSVSGTDEEENKYRLIHELYEIIQDFLKWSSTDKALTDLKYIGLILTNNGTDYDEDVEVSLSFPKSVLVTVDSFPELSDYNKDYLINERDLDEIFQIPATAEYLDYDDSIVRQKPLSAPIKPISDIYGSAYDNCDGFEDCLLDALGVNVYPANDNYIVKIQFDYIKHNTSVAFPAIILLLDDISEIAYTITSKHCAEKVNGTILVTK